MIRAAAEARRGRTLAFAVVDWRKSAENLGLAIDQWRLRRVAAGAEMFGLALGKANGAATASTRCSLRDAACDAIWCHVWQPLGRPPRRRK